MQNSSNVVLMAPGEASDRLVNRELTYTWRRADMATAIPGGRALFDACLDGNIRRVSLLLERDDYDLNLNGFTPSTPLLAMCYGPHPNVDVVRLLLEAGAHPTTVDKTGVIPLHIAAFQGHMEVVDVLYSRAPGTLNQCTSAGETSLKLACGQGNHSMVSKLLSLGAIEPPPKGDTDACPLGVAVIKGFVGVVRVLIREAGIEMVGGEEVLLRVLRLAIIFREVLILQLLLTASGKERRSKWANSIVEGRSLLHHAARYSYPAAVSVLLDAGANELAVDPEGFAIQDVIGICINQVDPQRLTPGDGVAIRRMLDRGPAFRARSWAWPVDEKEDTIGSGDGDDDDAADIDVVVAEAALSAMPVI